MCVSINLLHPFSIFCIWPEIKRKTIFHFLPPRTKDEWKDINLEWKIWKFSLTTFSKVFVFYNKMKYLEYKKPSGSWKNILIVDIFQRQKEFFCWVGKEKVLLNNDSFGMREMMVEGSGIMKIWWIFFDFLRFYIIFDSILIFSMPS